MNLCRIYMHCSSETCSLHVSENATGCFFEVLLANDLKTQLALPLDVTFIVVC